MSDHYSILGISKTASLAEIKTSYRRLVKLYHPDKNPNNPTAVEKFRLIQEAYDTLSDEVKRSKYDNKINYSSYAYSYGQTVYSQEPKTKSRTKTYTFSEEDLKRRQYYKEHYKQKSEKTKVHNPAHKKTYNEVKYILFSVPVAIALLFFIINIYKREKTPYPTAPAPNTRTAAAADSNQISKASASADIIKTADQPYNYIFGQPKVDKRTMQVVQVTNWSGMDAVVCIVNAKDNTVIRNYYVGNNYNILYEYLPEGTYYLKNYLGKNFSSSKKHPEHNVNGIFEGEHQFQNFSKDTFVISLSKHDTITRDIAYLKNPKNKNITDAKNFFGL